MFLTRNIDTKSSANLAHVSKYRKKIPLLMRGGVGMVHLHRAKGLFTAIVMQILTVDLARKEPGWVPK